MASEKKCGHMGGKVLVPTSQHVRTLKAARLAADVAAVPTLVIARTDSLGATLLTSDIDDADRPFVTGERTAEGFFHVRSGIDAAIARGLAYAPYSDLIWCETSTPDLDEAELFAAAIHERHPGKMLAYNCSPSFNWRRHLDDTTIARFQKELGAMGYRFQFITLAGFHALNAAMFELARGYATEGMTAYVALQEREFAMEGAGYTATRHQREVGAGYFDDVAGVISGGTASTLALEGSTEQAAVLSAAEDDLRGIQPRRNGTDGHVRERTLPRRPCRAPARVAANPSPVQGRGTHGRRENQRREPAPASRTRARPAPANQSVTSRCSSSTATWLPTVSRIDCSSSAVAAVKAVPSVVVAISSSASSLGGTGISSPWMKTTPSAVPNEMVDTGMPASAASAAASASGRPMVVSPSESTMIASAGVSSSPLLGIVLGRPFVTLGRVI